MVSRDQLNSSPSWRRHAQGKNHHFSAGGLSKLGARGGVRFCRAAKAVASSLLELRCAQGADGDTRGCVTRTTLESPDEGEHEVVFVRLLNSIIGRLKSFSI